jgi:hypothetical protein
MRLGPSTGAPGNLKNQPRRSEKTSAVSNSGDGEMSREREMKKERGRQRETEIRE